MKLSAPKKTTWVIGLIVGVLGIIGHFAEVQFLTEYSFILLLVGFLVLVAGTAMKEV